MKKIISIISCCLLTFWSGAFVFGLPGVLSNYWINKFHVSKGEIGNVMFFVLSAVGIFMFITGKLQNEQLRTLVHSCSFRIVLLNF